MRALLKDGDDNTLLIAEFYKISYDKNEQTVYITGEYDDYQLQEVEEEQYNNYLPKLLENNYVDLSSFKAIMS